MRAKEDKLKQQNHEAHGEEIEEMKDLLKNGDLEKEEEQMIRAELLLRERVQKEEIEEAKDELREWTDEIKEEEKHLYEMEQYKIAMEFAGSLEGTYA